MVGSILNIGYTYYSGDMHTRVGVVYKYSNKYTFHVHCVIVQMTRITTRFMYIVSLYRYSNNCSSHVHGVIVHNSPITARFMYIVSLVQILELLNVSCTLCHCTHTRITARFIVHCVIRPDTRIPLLI